ncbi:MAG: efflux RND transporter periplasmic adaptor subunit [Rhizobiaceae bacterium]|nr:efflux RND transporter periplasmic adaptor subunit [Rhizobiaceae bacterium]
MRLISRTPLALALLVGAAAWQPVLAEDAKPAAAAAATESAPAIRVVSAERREIVETLAVNGSIVARDEASVGTDLNGMVVMALNFDQGDLVRKGDILAVLDRGMLDTQLAQARASRAQAEASVAQMKAQIGDAEVGVKQAQEALERAVALKKKGVAAQSQLDNAENSAASARAKLDAARKAETATDAQLAVIDAQIAGIELQLSKTEVKAPADGLVLARGANVGVIVSPSSGPLFRIAIDGDFELEANVAETALPRLAVGMRSLVAIPGVVEPVEGKIRRISPEIDAKTRLGPIRIALPKDAPARAGGFAKASVEMVRRDGLGVPVSAVLYRGSQPLIQVVESGMIRTAEVTLGARAGSLVEVVSGLSEGAEVVARAGTFVADGDKVTPVKADETGAIKP